MFGERLHKKWLVKKSLANLGQTLLLLYVSGKVWMVLVWQMPGYLPNSPKKLFSNETFPLYGIKETS